MTTSALEAALATIRNLRPKRVVAFTGAGISAESGIPTFRGAGGLWKDFRAEELATPQAFRRDPALVWEWYEWRRGLIREAQPNAAHLALARLGDAAVVTQNVDGLHAAGGARNVIELHGNIFRVRCTREQRIFDHRQPFDSMPPLCTCGALLRPDVVWFGESLPEDSVAAAITSIEEADLLLVIGTSGVVYPAAGYANLCRGMTIEINPESQEVASPRRIAIAAKAGDATPPIIDAILEVPA